MRTWGRSACSIKWKGNKTWHRQLFLFSSSHQPAALLLLSFFFFFTPKTLLFDTFPILVSPFRFLLPCCSGIGSDETRPRDTSGRRCQHIDRLFFIFLLFIFFYRRFIPISGVSMSRTRLPCLYLNFGGWYWRSARRRVHNWSPSKRCVCVGVLLLDFGVLIHLRWLTPNRLTLAADYKKMLDYTYPLICLSLCCAYLYMCGWMCVWRYAKGC